MSGGFRAMLGVALGTFLIVVLAVAGAALGVAAFVGIQGPWPEGPVAQALAAFSRNGTLAVIAVVLLIIVGCLPAVGPRSWAALNPIVRSTRGVQGITVSDLLDITVARAVGFLGAVGLIIWAAPYAALDGPATTGAVALLPAPATLVTAFAALVLLALPYGVAGLFSLRRQGEFIDDYRIRPYDSEDADQDDWRHLRDRESSPRRDRRSAPPAAAVVEPLFPPGTQPAPAAPRAGGTAEPGPTASGTTAGSGAPTAQMPPEPTALASSTVTMTQVVDQAEDEPVLVFTIAAAAADPVLVFSPASGVEPRVWVAPPPRRVRPSYTPASRIKADDLLSPPVLFPDRRPPVATTEPAAALPSTGDAPIQADELPKKRKKKKGKKGKKRGSAPVNVTVHVHMPPPP